MSVVNVIIGAALVAVIGIIFFKFGAYRRKHNLAGLTIKYISASFGCAVLWIYLIAKEFAKTI